MRFHSDSAKPRGGSHHSTTPSVALSMVLLSLLLPACTRQDALPSDVTQAFEIAFTKHDLPGCLALFTDDAQILPEHGPVVSGLAEIEAFLKDQMTPVVSFNTETDMTLVRGDLAVEQGHFTVRNIRRGENTEMGKYIHIWRKVDGEWRLYRIMYNTDVAPQGLTTVEPMPEEAS